jgi:hypothetical protein
VSVLDGGLTCGLLNSLGEPLRGALFAHGDGVRVERLALCRVELDQSADRLCTCASKR